MNAEITLREAQDWLRERIEDGERCPCCTQWSQTYKRKINAGHAVALIKLYRACGTDWGHLATYDQSREGSKLAYWDLIEEESARRLDGGRSGWWRVTGRGVAFLRGHLSVPKYARVYDGRLLGLIEDGKTATIHDALDNLFDYRELMEGL